ARGGPRTDGIGVLDGVLIVDKSCVAAPTRVLDDGWIVVLDLVVEDLSLRGQRRRGDRWRGQLSGPLVHSDDHRPLRLSRRRARRRVCPGLRGDGPSGTPRPRCRSCPPPAETARSPPGARGPAGPCRTGPADRPCPTRRRIPGPPPS